jgi:hypothetical protein
MLPPSDGTTDCGYVVPGKLKGEAGKQSIEIAESNPEDVANASTSKMHETASSGDLKDKQEEAPLSEGCSTTIESRSMLSNRNVHEAGAERSPTTPSNVSSGCFSLTTLLAPRDTSVKEGATEAGEITLSPPSVDATGHRPVLPAEDISEAVVSSVLKEETMLERTTESGESCPESVVTPESTNKTLHSISIVPVDDMSNSIFSLCLRAKC